MTLPHTIQTPAFGDCLVPGCLNAPTRDDGLCEVHVMASDHQQSLADQDAIDIKPRIRREGDSADQSMVDAWEARAESEALEAAQDDTAQESARENEQIAPQLAPDRPDFAHGDPEAGSRPSSGNLPVETLSERQRIEDRREKAIEGRIQAILERLANEGGSRNVALRNASYALGRVVGGGNNYARSEASDELYRWAGQVDLPKAEARDVIEKGLTQGAADKWEPDEAPAWTPPARMPQNNHRRP